MKNIHKIVIILWIFSCPNKMAGQISEDTALNANKSIFYKPILSSEMQATYPYYLFNNGDDKYYKAKFNYSFGGAVNAHIRHTKYTAGFNFSTKKYFHKDYNDYYYDEINYTTLYYNIPLTISYPIFNNKLNKKNDLIIGGGIIWNIPLRYKADISYKNILPYSNKTYTLSKSGLGTGHSFQVLIRYQRRINKLFDYYFTGFFSYKYLSEYEYYSSMMAPSMVPKFAEDKFFIGISTGLEFYFKKKQPD